MLEKILHRLAPYYPPIYWACVLFPFIAGLFTLPFVIRHYRKYGGIAVIRVMVVYSFILYCMCAYFLTILPLPSREAVAAGEDLPVRLIPFYDIYIGMLNAGFDFHQRTSFLRKDLWLKFLLGKDFFPVAANVIMMVPFGIYLRYYFRLDAKKTILCGFLASLFFELTQYSGLYGIYARAYRYTEVDDLIANTLGTWIGYGLTPLFQVFLPTREEIDRISCRKGRRVTFLRRVFAAGIDVLFYVLLTFGLICLLSGKKLLLSFLVMTFVYFALTPLVLNGTPGLALLRLRIASSDGKKATFWQIFIRNFLLYGIEPLLALLSGAFLSVLLFTLLDFNVDWGACRIPALALSSSFPLIIFAWVLHSQLRYGCLPHDHCARTVLVGRHSEEGEAAE